MKKKGIKGKNDQDQGDDGPKQTEDGALVHATQRAPDAEVQPDTAAEQQHAALNRDQYENDCGQGRPTEGDRSCGKAPTLSGTS